MPTNLAMNIDIHGLELDLKNFAAIVRTRTDVKTGQTSRKVEAMFRSTMEALDLLGRCTTMEDNETFELVDLRTGTITPTPNYR